MTPRAAILLAVLAGALNSGCAMCQNHFDEYYAAYGGIRQRSDMVCGRVGSIFRPSDGGPIATDPGNSPGTQVDGDPWESESGDLYDDGFQPPTDGLEELPLEELPSFDAYESSTSRGGDEPIDARLPFPEPVTEDDPLGAADPIGFWDVSDMDFPLPN